MRLLLDTYAFLWAVSEPAKLGAKARAAIRKSDNELFVSAASAWEIATKFRLGKLPDADVIVSNFHMILARLQASELPVAANHALLAGSYPPAHRDPFDRMLAAQAELEGLIVVSRDKALDAFGVERLW